MHGAIEADQMGTFNVDCRLLNIEPVSERFEDIKWGWQS